MRIFEIHRGCFHLAELCCIRTTALGRKISRGNKWSDDVETEDNCMPRKMPVSVCRNFMKESITRRGSNPLVTLFSEVKVFSRQGLSSSFFVQTVSLFKVA